MVTVAVILDTRKVKKGGKYPLKLRIYVNGEREYYPMVHDLSKDDFNKLSASNINSYLKEIRSDIKIVEADASKAIRKIKPFNLKIFEQSYIKGNPLFKKKNKRKIEQEVQASEFDFTIYEKRFRILKEKVLGDDHISATYKKVVSNLIEERRIGVALSYQDSYYSLKKFKGDVPFSSITKRYLNQYEQWMLYVNKRSKATIGIKLRGLRTMFNEAISDKIISEEFYPFGRKKYKIPTAKGTKKPLDLNDIQKIYNYEPEKIHLQKAKAYWFFCYLGNGMNPKDFAYLKYKNIDGEYLRFIRAKTERETKDNPIVITVYLSEPMLAIIDKWGNSDRNPDNFIFPCLSDNLNPLEQYNHVRTLTKFISDGMMSIARELEVMKKINNAIGRKSFATIMKRAGASTEFIQEGLGHTVISTTENYLADFEDEVKKAFSVKLLAFKEVAPEPVSAHCLPATFDFADIKLTP